MLRPLRIEDFDDRFDGESCPECGDEYDSALVSIIWPDKTTSRDVFAASRICLVSADGDIRDFIDTTFEGAYEDIPILVAIEHTVSDDLTDPADDGSRVEPEAQSEPEPEVEADEGDRTPHLQP